MSSYVYIIAAVAGGKPCAPVKVGISDTPRGRFNTIKTASPLPLRLFYVLTVPSRADATRIESLVHQGLAGLRASGEWFNTEPDDAKETLAFAVTAYMTISLGMDGDVVEKFLTKQGLL